MRWLLLLLWSCNNQTSDKDMMQTLAKGMADCREDKINLLMQKNNIQTAFNYCAESTFNNFRWSFDGNKLFFGYYGNAYIQDGNTRTISPITIPKFAETKPAWLENNYIVLPLKQKKDHTVQNMVWYKPDGTYKEQELAVHSISDLHNWSKDTVLFSAKNNQNQRKAYTLTYGETEPKEVFSFVKESFDQMGYAPKTGVLGIVSNKKVAVYKEQQLVFRADNVNRIVPHPFEQFVILESTGKPVSVLKPIDTVGKSPEEIEREERKRKKVEEQLPDWMDKTYTPNEIHVVDLTHNKRYLIPTFFGKDFEWYTEKGFYCSLTLEAVAGEDIPVNVGLLDLQFPLGSIRLDKPERVEFIGEVGL